MMNPTRTADMLKVLRSEGVRLGPIARCRPMHSKSTAYENFV
jgi:hypothetical protein